MFRSFCKTLSIAIVTAFLAGVASAASHLPLKEKAVGALTSVAPGYLEFAAHGQANHFGNYTEVGSANVDLAGNVSNGQFTITAADGSTISGVFAGTYAPLPTGQVQMQVTAVYTSGTGRFAGATGSVSIVALVDGLAPGAPVAYHGVGTIDLP